MFERFTDRARKVMALANQEAQRLGHEYIGTEHILLGLVKEGSGIGANVLKNLGADLAGIRTEVERLVRRGPDKCIMGRLPQTSGAKDTIRHAIEEARNLNHHYVGTEHLLLGLLRVQDDAAARVLVNLGLKLDRVREEVIALLGARSEPWLSGEREAWTDEADEFIHNAIRQLTLAWDRAHQKGNKLRSAKIIEETEHIRELLVNRPEVSTDRQTASETAAQTAVVSAETDARTQPDTSTAPRCPQCGRPLETECDAGPAGGAASRCPLAVKSIAIILLLLGTVAISVWATLQAVRGH